jgi:hypothetical protein
MYLLGPSLAAALLGTRRVSARQGWAGEKSELFEHPVRVVLFFKAYTIEVLLRHSGLSSAY